MGGLIMSKPEEKIVYEKDIESLETIKRKIENDASNKIVQMYKDIKSTDLQIQKVEETLITIMSTGAEEFKQKTGRQMTYSEMREMYG